MPKELLNELEQDCLQELINLSYGKATAMIATVLDAFATMRVPSIGIVSKEQLLTKLSETSKTHERNYLTIQQFKGEFAGETLFYLDGDSASNLVAHLKEQNDDESVKDVVMELTNMVTSSLVSEFGKLLNTEVFFEEPYVEVSNSESPIDELRFSYEYVLLIDTVMEFEEQNIYGEIYIMMHENTFKWLKQSIEEVVRKYYS